MIEPTPGRPERRYCTAAHRAAARQARRASAHAASEPRLAAALPWVAEHGTDAAGGGTRLPEQRRVVAAGDAGEPHPAGLGGSPRGRPPLPAPAAVPRPAEARSAAVPPPPPRRRPGVPGRAAAPPPRRRRALAVLGAAGILAGGYAVTGGEPVRAPVAPAQPAAAGDESQWAARAEVALAAVTRQLDAIAEVEAAWHNAPASMRAGTPAEVRALRERKDVLERRRLILRSQLDTFQQLQEVQIELRAAEQRLRDVERQLQHVPPPGRRSPQQQAEIAVLEEQRALQAQRRDAKAAELAGLTEGVENAARVPLPDDSAKTAAVNEDVREVIEGGGEPRKPGDVAPPRPDLVAGRDQEGDRPRAEAHTSAPPDPRGPGEDEPGNREGGPVGTVTDTVDGVAGTLTGARSGGDDDRGEDRSDGGGADRSDRGGDSDGGARSGDTVDDTPAGRTGVLGGGSDDGRGRRDSVRDARGEERRAGPAEAGADRLEKGSAIAPAAQDRPGPRVRPAPRTLRVPAPAPVPSIAPAWAAEAAPFRSAPAAPSGGRRISAEQAATARAVVASVPAGWSAAPALEAAIAQQEHAPPGASSSSARNSPIGRDDSGSSPTGSSANGGSVTGRSPDRGWADPGRGPGGADPGSDSGGADSDGADSGGPDSGSDSDGSDSGSASDSASDSDSDSDDAGSDSDSGGSDSGGADSDSDSGGADSGSDWSDSH